MRPSIVLIGTGGPIASRYDPALGGTVASQRGEDLLAQVPQLSEIAAVEVDDFATIPSFDMSAEFAHRLSGQINHHLARRRRGRGGDPWHRHDGGELLPRRGALETGGLPRVSSR